MPPPTPFEILYTALREKEDRILSDEMVRALPDIAPDHPHYREWRIRKRTLQRLLSFLGRQYKEKPINILDFGCGNGWMSNQLAQQHHWSVWGADVNGVELEQAKKLFIRPNLRFLRCDMAQLPFAPGAFDVIILAASVQYFPDFGQLMDVLLPLLAPGGAIHILDSPFYPDAAARRAARERSKHYYIAAGFPEMSDYYFHHLTPRDARVKCQNLNKGWQKLFSPFPWYLLTPV